MLIEQLLAEQADHDLLKRLTADIRAAAKKAEFIVSTGAQSGRVNKANVYLGFTLQEAGGAKGKAELASGDRLPADIRAKGFLKYLVPVIEGYMDEGRLVKIYENNDSRIVMDIENKAHIYDVMKSGLRMNGRVSYGMTPGPTMGIWLGDTPDGVESVTSGKVTKRVQLTFYTSFNTGKMKKSRYRGVGLEPDILRKSTTFYCDVPAKDDLIKPMESDNNPWLIGSNANTAQSSVVARLDKVVTKFGGESIYEPDLKVDHLNLVTRVAQKSPANAVQLTREQLVEMLQDILMFKAGK
jgi:hypothetical protein